MDRIAITAGNQVITDSEIDHRIRLTAFENGDQPNFEASVRKTAADRLIDEKLVEHEMEVGHYPRMSAEQRAALLADYARQHYSGNLNAMDRALKNSQLTRNDLEEDLSLEADLLTFLGVRFRPAVQVTEQEVQRYGDEKAMPVDRFRNQIEQAVANQRADVDLEAWLKDQRKRTKIQYLEKDLAP